jgi:hypothetical protein
MKYLLEIADTVATKKEDAEIHKMTQVHKTEIEEEVTKISDKDVDEIFARLFPSGTPISTDFYNTLKNYQHLVGYGPAFYVLGGRIWARACREIAPDKQKVLLDSLMDEKGRGVWRAIFYLPEFCSRVEIEAQFAAGWFYRFGVMVKDDMANWDFFNGVKNYALHFPDSGMKVFETYISEQLDHLKISLSALFLGTIRSQAANGHFEKSIVNHWDNQIRTSPQINMRLIYYRSLSTSFDMGSLSIQELDCELTKMLKGAPEEISEAFSIVWLCLKSKCADVDFVKFAMDWLSKNVSSKLPDAAKHHLVVAMWFFRTPGKQQIDIKASEADDLLATIQPIPESNRGTWEYLEMYLVERLHQDTMSFESILGKFVDSNPKGMIAQFQSEVFDHLKSEICQAKIQDFVTRWSLSTDANKREIARAILQKAESVDFSQNVISETNEKQLETVLLEFIRRPLLAEKTSEYLLALEPAFRNVRPELKQMFKNEMILQAINYPGACLDSWKKIETLSELLKDVIVDAEKYFERLSAIKDSPAIAFTFPGCREAAEREAREFSNKVSKEAREKSIFAKLAKNIQIIYGSRWSVMVEGKLGQTTDFNEISHSAEFPRVEIIDPEGMAIRRIQSISQIKDPDMVS